MDCQSADSVLEDSIIGPANRKPKEVKRRHHVSLLLKLQIDELIRKRWLLLGKLIEVVVH